MNMGGFIENLLASLEFRLRKAYKIAQVDPANHDLDAQILRVLLSADEAGLSEAEFLKELKEFGAAVNDNEWIPETKI
jgi:hypothetical protein